MNYKIITHFGKKEETSESIREKFPELHFRSVKQIHSPIILKSFPESSVKEADGHYTSEKNIALLIKTADCVPLMMYASDIHEVMALHAGWKGVANRIFPHGLNILREMGASLSKLKLYIGPHIQKESFEVDAPVKDELLKSILIPFDENIFVEKRNTKYHLDLQQILILQGEEYGISQKQWHLSHVDTKTNEHYNSFRRDKDSSGRNLSFIAMV